MEIAPIPGNEKERLKALYASFLLDTGNEEGFDRITRLAQSYFGTKLALFSLVDKERQWFKSKQGISASETARDISFCGHAINENKTFIVQNALEDSRFTDNPLVTGDPHIRFYAGVPICYDGYPIGSMCIVDDKPRTLSTDEISKLEDIAQLAQVEINTRMLQRNRDSLTLFAQITALDDASIEAQLRETLELGCKHYGLEFGIISRIERDNNLYEVVIQVSPPDTIRDHQVFPFDQTYCHLTIKQGSTVDINHLGQSEYAGHPCYQAFKLESYIGTPIYIDNKLYGTVNFSSADALKKRIFSKEDKDFIQLLSQWISKSLKRIGVDNQLRTHQKLNEAIARAQSEFIVSDDRQRGFDTLLTDILSLTNSEYGFIGEVLYQDDNTPYLKTYAITDISWDSSSKNFYEKNAPSGLEFFNLNTLFGKVLTTGNAVISNHPLADHRSGGLPKGHPPLNAFLGIPIRNGTSLVAMVGIANRPEGYDQELVDLLKPLLSSTGQLIEAERIDRKRRESERRLQDVVSATQLTTWEWDIKTGFANVNEQWAESLGYTLDEIQPVNLESWSKLVHPGDLEKSREALNQHLQGKNSKFGAEYRMRHKDGRWIWVHDHGRIVKWDNEGNPVHMSGIRQDVNEERRAQLLLNEQAEHTQTILDNMADGLISYDEAGLILSVNRAAEKMFGYKLEEIKGEHICILFAKPARDENTQAMLNKPFSDIKEKGRKFEVEGLRQNGIEFTAEISISIVSQLEAPIFVAVMQDISERKRVERMKREFVSTVSHELRTPLTSISGAIGLIKKNSCAELSPRAEKMVNIAYKNCNRLTLLINDLLDMEKLEAGKIQLNLLPHTLLPLVESAVEGCVPSGVEQGVDIKIIRRTPEARVVLDGNRFSQILTNLLSNAIKFSPPNSTVTVTMDVNEQLVYVMVRDEGPGISQEFSKQIFRKFAQQDSSDTREKSGTGLGLAISQELAHRMGGEIAYDPDVDRGACFYVKFPLIDASANEYSYLSTDETHPRVLVVEDERDVAELLAIMLSRVGYNIDVAYTGTQALEYLSKNHYAAMTLDLALPDISGLDIIHRVRLMKDTSNLPIVVLSAKMEEGRLELNGNFSGIEWLAKPIQEELLFNTLLRQIKDQRSNVIEILNIGNDPLCKKVVHNVSRSDFHFTGAGNISEACEAIEKARFDVILLDPELPDGSGWELLPLVKKKQTRARVILLTGNEISLEQSKDVEGSLAKTSMTSSQLIETIGSHMDPDEQEAIKFRVSRTSY